VKKHSFGIFFLVYAAVLLYKLWGLVSFDQILPSGDAFAHFVTLKEFIATAAAGAWPAYSHTWFGGIPFLQFYAPFSFFLMGGLYAVLGKIFSLFLVFRFFIFLSLLVFPFCFFTFLKEYLGERAAQYGVWTSFAWIFYPKLLSATGIGASGAIFYGLFAQTVGICFLFLFLVYFRRMLFDATVSWRPHIASAVLLALVILTHTVTTMQAFFIVLLLSAYYRKELFASAKRFGASFSALAVGILLSAFWFIPFVSNLAYTSAERINSSVYKNPLLLFFPFDLAELFRGNFAGFEYGWFALAVLFVFGLIALIREKQHLLPYLLATSYFVMHTDYIYIFSRAPIHYYRFFPFEFALFLGIAAWGFMRIAETFTGKKIFHYALHGVAGLLLIHIVFSFNLGGGSVVSNNNPRLSGLAADIPYFWSLDEFSEMRNAQDMTLSLSPRNPALPEAPFRVLPAFNPQFSTETLSSKHFFDVSLPLAHGEDTLFGLYAESAWQLPFIFPATDVLLEDNLQWGKVSGLRNNAYFQSQDPETMAERIRLFGTNYVITSSPRAAKNMERIKNVEPIHSKGPFSLFFLGGAKPRAYAPGYRPGLYIDADGSTSFRDFALGWYSEEKLLDRPVAWISGKRATDITEADIAPFDFVVVGMTEENPWLLTTIEASGKPTLIVNVGSQFATSSYDGKAIEIINDFKPIARYYDGVFFEQPNAEGLVALERFIVAHAKKNESPAPLLRGWSDSAITLEGKGPVILNAGYFPYWQRNDGEAVYGVTPGQMLVFASGTVAVDYRGGTDVKAGMWMTGAGLLALGGLFLAMRKRKISADL